MYKENIGREFKTKNTEETRNYFVKEIDPNELMINKHEKVYTTLNYINFFLILVSAVSGCVSISIFASLVGTTIGIKSPALGLQTCAIVERINIPEMMFLKDKTILKLPSNKK